MVKNTHHRPHIGRHDVLKKSSHKPTFSSNGDEESKLSTSSRTPVYVHHFKTKTTKNTTPVPVEFSNVYSHGFQDYYAEKAKFIKNKFDSLTLVSKHVQNSHSSYRNRTQNIQNSKGSKNECPVYIQQETIYDNIKPQVNNLRQVDEAVINKLEESYWANWKPSKYVQFTQPKQSPAKLVYSDKTSYIRRYPTIPSVSILNQSREKSQRSSKTIYSERKGIESDHVNETPKESSKKIDETIQYLHKPTEVSESKSSEIELNILEPSSTFSINKSKDSVGVISSKSKTTSEMEPTEERKAENDGTKTPPTLLTTTTVGTSNTSIKKDLRDLEQKLSRTVQPHLVPSNASTSVTEEVHMIKHTDSFIITSKKQNAEKPHYPQPKCIKLQKNANSLNRASYNYIKGGSYPLKSCLKKEKISSQSLVLGKPGSPMLLQPNKNKKTRKSK